MKIRILQMVMGAVFFSSVSVSIASPDITRATIGNLVSLRVSIATVSHPEPFEGDKKLLKEDEKGRFATVAPSSLIKWAEVSFYQSGPALPSLKGWSPAWQTWFSKTKWGGVDDDEPAGLAPAAVLILPDDKDPDGVWILHLWEGGALLFAGRSCGSGAYQEHPNSKQAGVAGKELLEALWKSTTEAREAAKSKK